jgi:hypothetical protein
MPGFLKTKDISSNFILSNGTEVYSEKFYGFEYDPATGGLTINEVDDKSEVIRLPATSEPTYFDKYLAWIWSGTELTFSWDTTNYTRLLVEVE